jgi:hypothetical protein
VEGSEVPPVVQCKNQIGKTRKTHGIGHLGPIDLSVERKIVCAKGN